MGQSVCRVCACVRVYVYECAYLQVHENLCRRTDGSLLGLCHPELTSIRHGEAYTVRMQSVQRRLQGVISITDGGSRMVLSVM
jgi:hypothetical protein